MLDDLQKDKTSNQERKGQHNDTRRAGNTETEAIELAIPRVQWRVPDQQDLDSSDGPVGITVDRLILRQ